MSDAVEAPKRKLKPARKQVKPGDVDTSEKVQPGKEYNIWYNKWAGGDKEDALAMQTLSQTRCVITRDAGYTRADATGNRFCCLFFARGRCPYGAECNFLHRLPLPHQVIDHSRDCFGREKHADYRDDMGGVGSFNRSNRTLYIGKIHESPDKDQSKETLLRHFGEWGKIDKWNILYNRGIAFVSYRNEVNAQFAKEAMQNQSMDMDEILNVRWATEDPNPGEKNAEERRIAKEGQKVIASKLDANLIEAAQTLRALEDGDVDDLYHIEESVPEPEAHEEDERPAKRARADAAPASGLFGNDALDNIRYYADLARKQAEEERGRARKTPAAKPTGVALLGGYDSGDESD
ncbi:Pre-mRNA-splicing factor CWC2 [Vanrija pseudolonga]|uniref:Pre-mRNA-splicing factor CWC2 n=1 Tax=Vanrija pseudolonga TaxID=143232 RepID=A0AAF0Y6J2_9TREE|nr:Pre-mRNA-splicing factor CWC2 [Vanrija pseudolonga]